MEKISICLNEIKSCKLLTEKQLELLFRVYNIQLKERINILEKYVGKTLAMPCVFKAKNGKDLYNRLIEVTMAVKTYLKTTWQYFLNMLI